MTERRGEVGEYRDGHRTVWDTRVYGRVVQAGAHIERNPERLEVATFVQGKGVPSFCEARVKGYKQAAAITMCDGYLGYPPPGLSDGR